MLARKDALTAKNCIAGFTASGLWPVRMAKPLINRLLLENSNKAIEPALSLSRKRLLPEWNEESASIAFQTPQKSDNIR